MKGISIFAKQGAKKGDIMATTAIKLDKELVNKAQIYAASEGKTLSSIIEDFLLHLTTKESKVEEIPDIVLSLLGAGTPVNPDDINGREAYYSHLEQKHQ